MPDRTTKWLLTLIALALCGLLIHTSLPPAQAQFGSPDGGQIGTRDPQFYTSPAPQTSANAVMTIDHGVIYLAANGLLEAFQLDPATHKLRKLDQFSTDGPSKMGSITVTPGGGGFPGGTVRGFGSGGFSGGGFGQKSGR